MSNFNKITSALIITIVGYGVWIVVSGFSAVPSSVPVPLSPSMKVMPSARTTVVVVASVSVSVLALDLVLVWAFDATLTWR